MSVEDLSQEGTEMTLGDSPAHYGASTATKRYWWIEEIENPELVQKLMLLCADDIEVLTCLVFEECTQEETAEPAVISGNWITSADEPWREESDAEDAPGPPVEARESERGNAFLPGGFYQRA